MFDFLKNSVEQKPNDKRKWIKVRVDSWMQVEPIDVWVDPSEIAAVERSSKGLANLCFRAGASSYSLNITPEQFFDLLKK